MKKHIVSLTLLFSFAIALFAPLHAADIDRRSQRIFMIQRQLSRAEQRLEMLESEEQEYLEAAETGDPETLQELQMIQNRMDQLRTQIDTLKQRIDLLHETEE